MDLLACYTAIPGAFIERWKTFTYKPYGDRNVLHFEYSYSLYPIIDCSGSELADGGTNGNNRINGLPGYPVSPFELLRSEMVIGLVASTPPGMERAAFANSKAHSFFMKRLLRLSTFQSSFLVNSLYLLNLMAPMAVEGFRIGLLIRLFHGFSDWAHLALRRHGSQDDGVANLPASYLKTSVRHFAYRKNRQDGAYPVMRDLDILSSLLHSFVKYVR